MSDGTHTAIAESAGAVVGMVKAIKHAPLAIYTRNKDWTDVLCLSSAHMEFKNGATVDTEYVVQTTMEIDADGVIRGTLWKPHIVSDVPT